MQHIPLAAFPAAEQHALWELVRQLGLPPRCVCVSRTLWAAASLPGGAYTTVTTPWLCRSYPADAGPWIDALRRDLLRSRDAAG